MRNIEECKAEVFRRSEERIKERKRTWNRVLACCIPLCLLLVAGGLYIRPLLEPMDEIGEFKAGDTGIPDRVLGGLDDGFTGSTLSYTSVKITDKTGAAEVSRQVTDAKKVGELGNFIAMYFGVPTLKTDTNVDETYGKETSDGAEKDETTAGQDRDTIEHELRVKYGLEEKPAHYILGFRNAAGEEFLFLLYENHLYNEENGCVVVLSDEKLSALKELLDSAE